MNLDQQLEVTAQTHAMSIADMQKALQKCNATQSITVLYLIGQMSHVQSQIERLALAIKEDSK